MSSGKAALVGLSESAEFFVPSTITGSIIRTPVIRGSEWPGARLTF
ncbi:hypothetical protein [Paenibacillus sp.]|nr:hypothetical protein [Paenibacillus sp.]